MLVQIAAIFLIDLVASHEGQGNRNQVLHADSRERARHAHQHVRLLGGVGDCKWRDDGKERKENTLNRNREFGPSEPPLKRSLEEGLEILSQCNGYDGKVGTECEYGKQSYVRAKDQEDSLLPGGEEIKRVQLLHLTRRECENSRVTQQDVEHNDEGKISSEQEQDPSLVTHRSDHTRNGVLAHERIDTDPKQLRETAKDGRRRGVDRTRYDSLNG